MALFLIGIAILIGGGAVYGRFCEKSFCPDDRPTPAVKMADGVDYVVMPKWKNMMIELLNIAGTGPVLGPIQGILFGPVAFLTIPIGCVLAGSVHDYFIGMISMRNNGAQVPRLVEKYLGGGVQKLYSIIIWLLMLLTGTVFIYTPGDLIVNDIMGADPNSGVIWIVYGAILFYYILSTIFPIDVIIGKIYPFFAGILIVSAIGILAGVIMTGAPDLHNFTNTGLLFATHPGGQVFVPVFFITVACGIMSGFHGSQATLISRTVRSEKEGRSTFYNMMIAEGLIAMIWAAGAMVLFNRGTAIDTSATLMVGIISKEFMGTIGGTLAILGVIVLPITSGDTSFRALRLMIAEQFNLDQKTASKRVGLSFIIFIPATAILVFAKTNANGFNLLWRYFGFTNQLVAVFALAMITSYLKAHSKNYFVTLIPGAFYTFIVTSYISHADIGLRLDSLLGFEGYQISYAVGVVVTIAFLYFITKTSDKRKEEILRLDGK